MAGLNPNAPAYIPSSLIFLHHPSNLEPFNQALVPIIFFSGTPLMYPELCYYLSPPHPLVYSTPTPFQVPKSHQGATLTLLSDGEKEKIKEKKLPETRVNEEMVECGCKATAKVRMGFWRTKVLMPKGRGRRRVVQPRNERKVNEEFEFKKDDICAREVADGGKTTLMIKNLPNKFSKEKLLGILDQHCHEENQKLNNEGNGKPSQLGDGEGSSATLSEFDFLYLPIDFTTGSNMGYAFVNFTSTIAARRLYNFLHDYDWKPHDSRKICEVTYARIQGLPALKKHFKNSTFVCVSDDFLPVCFVPPRNGYSLPEQQFIGRRLPVPNLKA